jgi:hypothetical protein
MKYQLSMKRKRWVNSAQTEFRDPTPIPKATDRNILLGQKQDSSALVSDAHRSTQKSGETCGIRQKTHREKVTRKTCEMDDAVKTKSR